ncbi:MAG: fluoride efflux transporter CrcB [Lewinellaceae bacterium]|nr:fluoride efflux transporter CrcB [Lewinellaceae bacterium]
MQQGLYSFLLVFLGGGLGSISRYGIGLLTLPMQTRFPVATFLSNALACLLLGVLVGLQMKGHMDDTRRLLLATGFCGGFSTFSTFSAETWNLLQDGQTITAVANIALSLTIGMLCLLLGLKLT